MRILLSAFLLSVCMNTMGQLNISLVGHLDYQALRQSNLSNLWGYTDETGIEYALVGVNGGGQQGTGGISVVSLEDPANPVEIFFFAGPNSIWREVKVWEDHAYITTEAESGGITIVDLSPLPQSNNLNAILWNAPDWSTSHSLFIDENGRLYLHGHNRDPGNGGAIMYDLTQDPMNPVEVGEFDQWYVHDSFAQNNILYAAHVYDGFFSIVDVSDPANPVLLGTQPTPSDFTHNTWQDDSGQFLFTTDERPGSYIGAYDVSDPSDIQEVDRLRSDVDDGAIIHNTYWHDNKLYHSYYTKGVAIYDVTYPHNMVEVGNYDTYPGTGNGFNGAWGVYPYFPSGRIIISDIEGGLFVLQPDVPQACWLEGVVTNSQTSAPIAGATVNIAVINITESTQLSGAYATGYHTAGNYAVQVSAPGYSSETIFNVGFVAGQVTTLNVQLDPLTAFSIHGNVITAVTGAPVPNAQVVFSSPSFNLTAQADAAGEFDLPTVFEDDYVVTAAQWGWRTVCLPAQNFTAGSGPFTITMEEGYYDDMVTDLGWEVSGTATAGMWERGVPQGTSLGNTASNPGADVTNDCGEQAYVTGNGGGSAGDDDVDGGSTVLSSPVFDATEGAQPHVRYKRWFFNGGGSGNPNDTYRIEIFNGTSTAAMETITAATAGSSSWQQSDFAIASFVAPTANMRLIATAVDGQPGHVLEAGLDEFELVYENTSALPDAARVAWSLWPNPNSGQFNVRVNESVAAIVEVMDATGRMVDLQRLNGGSAATIDLNVGTGAYLVRIRTSDGRMAQERVIVME
ncbi:MAG: choice-of-anchor B family protein [Flavobacteriales bacterium]|nr:choice-of-anchor B family protein [Flavobacteriales bacterium]